MTQISYGLGKPVLPLSIQPRSREKIATLETMSLLVADEKFHYYHFDHTTMPAFALMLALINGARRSIDEGDDQAVFTYDEKYLNWILRPDTFDGIWVTTPQGDPAGILLLSRRIVRFEHGNVPAHYASLFSIAEKFRGMGIEQQVYEVYFYHMVKDRRVLVGIMNREMSNQKQPDSFVVYDRTRTEKPIWAHVSRPYTMWVACRDVPTLLRYVPLPGMWKKLAEIRPLRRLFESRRKNEDRVDHRMAQVNPKGIKGLRALGFFPERCVLTLYNAQYPETGGTYRATFSNGKYCEIYYAIHTLTKRGLPPVRCGQIQMIDRGTASSSQIARALKSANQILFQKGCVAVRIPESGMVSLLGLLRAGFVPSDSKVRFFLGGHRSLAGGLTLNKKLFFDML